MLKNYIQVHASLTDWFNTSHGQKVKDTFVQQLRPYRTILHGQNLLQMGCFTENPWLDPLPYQHKWLLSPHNSNNSSILSSFSQLPFDRGSINSIIAPLSLNILNSADWPIDELDRILKPMGYLIILAVNPLSFWGAALRLGMLAGFDGQRLAAMSAFNLQRTLERRGYTQYHLEYFYYMPPVSNPALLDKLSFLNPMGQMLPVYPAAFYLLIMQKYEPAHPDLTAEVVDEAVIAAPNV